MSRTELVQSGKYTFRITKNIQVYRDEIIIHTYKIGGDYADCVNISYRYSNNKPIQAKIPHLLYEPECATSFLEKGSGTELMIKTALRYAHRDVPSITAFEFDDDSHIDCIDKNLSATPPRKPKRPLSLAFLYIVYHDKTWYEATFNAKMINPERYKKYRKSLEFLTDPSKKPLSFTDFLQIIGASLESLDKITTLEQFYKKTTTYREFFELIPRKERCEVLSGWLNTFMNYYIGKTFDDRGWYIDVNTMDPPHSGGALSRVMDYRIFSYKHRSSL